MTKAELARQIGVQRQNIAGMLKTPTLSSMGKIATALGVDVWQLLATPDEICGNLPKNDFIAMVKMGNDCYYADSIEKLEKLIADWKAQNAEK